MKKNTLLILLGIVYMLYLGVSVFNKFFPVRLNSPFSFDDVVKFENMNMIINETGYTQFDGDLIASYIGHIAQDKRRIS